jgi:subtilase family serine protease
MVIAHARQRVFALLTLAVFALSGCGGGHASSSPLPALPQQPAGPAGPSSFAYASDFLRGASLLGPASFGRMAIDVVLKMQNPVGLRAYAQQVSDPRSLNYRRFLTPQQIGDMFDATQADQNAAASYFAGQGLTVGAWPQRMMLRVEGTQSELETAFHTKFGEYAASGETVIGPMIPPSLPANVPVVGSANIVHRTRRFAATIYKTLQTANGNLSGYSPQQIANAFDFTGAYAAGYTGSGMTIGIIGTGGISVNSSGHVGDVEAFKKIYGIGGGGSVSVIAATDQDPQKNAASGFTTPPPVTASSASCTDGPPAAGGVAPNIPPSESPSRTCNPEDVEAQIDTEQSASLAPDAHIEFYLAYNANDGCKDSSGKPVVASPCPVSTPPAAGQPGGPGFPLQGLAEVDEELQTAIDRHTADVLSLSFGGAEFGQVSAPGGSPPAEFDTSGNGLEPTEFAALASLGIAVFAATGDAGAEACQPSMVSGKQDQLCVNYPATDPNVVAVGGVTAPLNGAGQFIGPMTAWGLQTGAGAGATGGGISNYFALPAYQQGAAGITGTNRNIPDVALEADVATGIPVLMYADPSYGGSALFDVGGTSVATPEMATMWALVLEACKATPSCTQGGSYRLGNPNPLFYQIYGNSTAYQNTFYDVTYGDNALLPNCQIHPCSGATPGPNPTGPLDPGYSAAPGYDLLTGIGVPFARALIRAVVKV